MLGSAFSESIAANLVAGIILLGLTVLVVNVWFASRDQRRENVQRRKAALKAVKTELEWNQGQTDDLRDPKVATPPVMLYSVSGWDLVNQVSVFRALAPGTISTLCQIYTGLRYLNDANKVVGEHFFSVGVTEIEFSLRRGDDLERLRPLFEGRQKDSLVNLVSVVNELLYPQDCPGGLIGLALESVDYELSKESLPPWRKALRRLQLGHGASEMNGTAERRAGAPSAEE